MCKHSPEDLVARAWPDLNGSDDRVLHETCLRVEARGA